MKALDIGAGLGKMMIAMQNAGFDVYGFEPSVSFHKKAIEKMKILPEKLKLGMIEELSYPKDYFDFISFGAVLEHLYNPADALQKAMTWVRPCGLIHIEGPSSKYLIPKIFNLHFKLKGTNYVNNISPMHRSFHLHEFSEDFFLLHAKNNGYEIAHKEYYVCDIYFIPKIFHRLLKWYMTKTNKGMQLAVWLRKNN